VSGASCEWLVPYCVCSRSLSKSSRRRLFAPRGIAARRLCVLVTFRLASKGLRNCLGGLVEARIVVLRGLPSMPCNARQLETRAPSLAGASSLMDGKYAAKDGSLGLVGRGVAATRPSHGKADGSNICAPGQMAVRRCTFRVWKMSNEGRNNGHRASDMFSGVVAGELG
jgi:hypothetical protein